MFISIAPPSWLAQAIRIAPLAFKRKMATIAINVTGIEPEALPI